MEELWVGVLGTAGTILSTVSLFPQVVRTWRTRSAKDISAIWLMAALMSMLIWTAYGCLIGAPALVLVNVLCFFQCAYILLIKVLSERASIATPCAADAFVTNASAVGRPEGL
jgi:MtN3 and saliva related transmembrane protein